LQTFGEWQHVILQVFLKMWFLTRAAAAAFAGAADADDDCDGVPAPCVGAEVSGGMELWRMPAW